MIKVAMLSRWHVHAIGYAREILATGKAQITWVWDEDPERGKEWAKELGAGFEPDLDKLLARDDVEAVAVDAPTSIHHDVILKAAQAGKHIFTEKVLCPTVKECKSVADAIRKAGVQFTISFPHRTFPINIYAKHVIEQGWLGQINYLRIRNAHSGASDKWLPEYWYDMTTTCGGAMMDLGCHPMYLAPYLLGKPVRVASIFNSLVSPGGMDDNCVSVVEFENKVIAVLETSFVTPFAGTNFELSGTEGVLILEGNTLKLRSRKLDVEGWVIPDLPKPDCIAINQWIDSIESGKPSKFTIDDAIMLTVMMENAYVSDKEQKIVKIQA